jgi:hypothetical protein
MQYLTIIEKTATGFSAYSWLLLPENGVVLGDLEDICVGFWQGLNLAWVVSTPASAGQSSCGTTLGWTDSR